MRGSVDPAIIDLERKKRASRTQHPVHFGKRAILEFPALQVMQYKDGNSRGERLVGKGKRGRIAAERCDPRAWMIRFQFS